METRWKVGDIVHGFRVNHLEYVKEVSSEAYEMVHVKSGAKLLYLDNHDDNKVFFICFRTPPANSKGTPHIMEHSTLCGSRKFPLKEPFVELAKGSLNTFLNAITWPDKTMYPIASRNQADFHNLMDVYLDAVFYPNCLKNPQILMQEGWHYEMADKNAPLTYNGVVYNEMKGALSSPEAIMEDDAMAKLFPDTTYGVESGGDPEVIPALTFREFTDFHRRFYHPSNSYIYLYGDMDIDGTLKFINDEYLSHFSVYHVDSAIKTQSPFKKRVSCEYEYGVTENENTKGKAIHALYTAFNDHMTVKESMAFKILNYVLIEMDGAPLKKAILDAHIGTDVSGGYEEGLKQPTWTVEVTGSEPDLQSKFAEVTDKTLLSLAVNGIDKKMLDAALNRMEFTLRENDFRGQPKGLYYGVRAMNLWLYDRDPIDALRYIQVIDDLRQGVKDGYFESILSKYVIKNNHQVLITMKPQKGLTEKKDKEVAEKLAAYKASLTSEEIDQIIASTKALKERQASGETEEALETIPLLTREDLKRPVEKEVLNEEKRGEIPTYFFDTDTNGIHYVALYFKLYGLSSDEIPYAYLIANLLSSLSTKKHSYQELEQLSNANTGGFSFNVSGIGQINDDSSYLPVFTVNGKALTTKTSEMMDLLSEILNETIYDDGKRTKELLLEQKAEWDLGAFARGHLLVMSRLVSYFSANGRFNEEFGLTYYYFLADLLKRFDKDQAEILGKIKDVAHKIFTKSNLFIEVMGQKQERDAFDKHLDQLIGSMPEGTAAKPHDFVFPAGDTNEAFSTSGKVQYVAKGGNFRKHGFNYTGALRVMETILRYEYLWKKVRVLGGAYGAFTSFLRDGTAILCSYRDPNLKETLKAYDDLPKYLETLTLSDREMTKYVIGTMAADEIQLTPFMKGTRAMIHKLNGYSYEERVRDRNEVINCTVEDIRKLAPLVESVINDSYICVMGSEDKIKSEKDLFHAVKTLPN